MGVVEKLAIFEAMAGLFKNLAGSKDIQDTIIKILAGGKGHGEEKFTMASLGMSELNDDDKKTVLKVLFDLMDKAIKGDKEINDKLVGFMLMLSTNVKVNEDGLFCYANEVWKMVLLNGSGEEEIEKSILRLGFNFRHETHAEKFLDLLKRSGRLPVWGKIRTALREDGLDQKISDTTSSLRAKTAAWRARREGR